MERRRSRIARNGSLRLDWTSPEVWGPILLAGGSLLVGGLFQEPVQFGWLAPAAAGMLLVRLGVPFGAAQPQVTRPAEGLPVAPAMAWLWGVLGAGLLGLFWFFIPPAALTAAWAVAGLALIFAGRGEPHYPLRFAGSIGLLLAVGQMAAGQAGGNLIRQSSAGVAMLAFLLAIWTYRPGKGEGLVRGLLAVCAHLVGLWVITYEVAAAIPLDRGATSMGNEALWMATAWGLYGLMLVLTSPWVSPDLPWKGLGQIIFTCALLFLLMGGLMAQARWADPLPRFASYAGVPGAMILAAWAQKRSGSLTEPDRLLALAAAALGFGILSFEVLRWLEPVFTYPQGTTVTPAMLARDRNLQTLWTLGLWALYTVLLWGIGERLRSRSVRFLALVLLVSALVYGLFWRIL